MNINDRINYFSVLFEELQLTNSRTEKEGLVAFFLLENPELEEDWYFILETLAGKHPIGWTFIPSYREESLNFHNIQCAIEYCLDIPNKSDTQCTICEDALGKELGEFIAPIVNRTLRLGIGKSLLSTTQLSPMLAKKYEGEELYETVCVTEKLDGNRCISYHDGEKWNFVSRNGKPMRVDFDMSEMNTDDIYDGEVLSYGQMQDSIERFCAIREGRSFQDAKGDFSVTSGTINAKTADKSQLYYAVFDIIDEELPYWRRRRKLNRLAEDIRYVVSRVQILPVLYAGTDNEQIAQLLYRIVETGGEGVMLNNIYGLYEHKRTKELLKYKQVQTMDMEVIGVYEGKGKYEGLVGGLVCKLEEGDMVVQAEVGSGLSDLQRFQWARDNQLIIGKIVEVAYFSTCQNQSTKGTNTYSLRFPRLKQVRTDKTETSIY